MLTKVMRALWQTQGPIGLVDLASQLEIDVSALEGMLEQLVRQGKLRRSKEMTVEECRIEHESGLQSDLCAYLTYGNMTTRYEITES
jgi:DNA-binding MarR family transcriptional regulator